MKNVLLKITGKIVTYDNGQEISDDVMEFITEGKMQSRGRTTMLVYPEMQDSGLEGCTTYVTVSPSRVRVKREEKEGSDPQVVMEFEKGKRCDGLYITPYGPMPLELLTNSISGFGHSGDGSRTLSIDYSMSLKGLAQTSNRLDIQVLRELGEEADDRL